LITELLVGQVTVWLIIYPTASTATPTISPIQHLRVNAFGDLMQRDDLEPHELFTQHTVARFSSGFFYEVDR